MFERIKTVDSKNNFFKLKLEKLKNSGEEIRKLFLILIAISTSFAFSIKEGKTQTLDKNIQNLEIYTDIEKEFNAQKDFLSNWFKNRIIEDKKFNKKFENERNDILKRLENVVLSETKSISEWRNDTIFINPVDFDEEKGKTTIIHELSHDAFPANYGSQPEEELRQTMPAWMIELIKEAIEISGDDSLQNVRIFKKYYQRPEEVYARICALRQKYNINPKDKISEEILNQIIKENREKKNDSNIETLLMTVSNKRQLLKLLNNLP